MNRLFLIALCFMSAGVAGCDPVTIHKVTSTIVDGVPSLPPAQEFCPQFQENLVSRQKGLVKNAAAEEAFTGSKHRPYFEKKCGNCHDNSKESGLIRPRKELCFVCHPTMVSKRMQHGPATVGDCLKCHEPHWSNYPYLLKTSSKDICGTCHKEKRLAEEMHGKVVRSGMLCFDCHDPHSGDARYFLR